MNMFWIRIETMGRTITENLEYTFKIFLMIYLAFRAAFLDQTQGFRQTLSVLSTQIYFTGWQAMPLISILALGTGGILVIQGMSNLTLLGGTEMIGNLIVVVLVREVGPVGLRRLHRHRKLIGDLLVRAAPGNKTQHGALTIRQQPQPPGAR